ncbi:hypothetical protein FPV67DRAFT_1448115 [Lyophyllum atratum]|nr:hypothetical protein FPV67DRAFT_1448115 [Lyophyllum atratum]
MPKAHRGGSTNPLRPHSRTPSTSKLNANLQFTQKEQPPKPLDKPKKHGTIAHDNTQAHGKGIARVASAQRVHSREHMQPFLPKQRAPLPQNPKASAGKAGFTISSTDEEDDEDAWVSSESGAATPSNDQSGSETESDNIPDEEIIRRLTGEHHPQTARPTKATRPETPVLPRVETARPADFSSPIPNPSQQNLHHQDQRHDTRSETRTPTLPPIKTGPLPHLQHVQAQNRRSFDNETIHELSTPEVPSPSQPSPRPSGRRQASTRPPSSHSVRGDHTLRPHPLIRGQSYGQVYPTKPAPLEPLTVIQDASSSASPPDSAFDGGLSISPSSSINTNATSPGGPDRGSSSQQRRTSISSTRSVATLPVHSGLRESVNWSLGDRKRTLSTVSHSSSSAALSSLVHLPTVTRPPSPQPISFFPPVNPHANIEGIHPLLPGPYLNNHLTVLARRTPIKEAFDRVIRAKQVRS